MATFTQWVNSKRWIMQEKGLQTVWNEMKQIANSQFGPAANTVIGTVIISELTAEGATTIKSNGAGTNSGLFDPTAQASTLAGGLSILRADPGTPGGFGPTPRRSPTGNPATTPQLDGFRTP